MQHLKVIKDNNANAFLAGQRVFGQVGGSLGSHVLAAGDLLVPVPPEVTLEQAATMPTVFMTAHLALHHAMPLQTKNNLLIHAAAGGLAFSSLHLCQLYSFIQHSTDNCHRS